MPMSTPRMTTNFGILNLKFLKYDCSEKLSSLEKNSLICKQIFKLVHIVHWKVGIWILHNFACDHLLFICQQQIHFF